MDNTSILITTPIYREQPHSRSGPIQLDSRAFNKNPSSGHSDLGEFPWRSYVDVQ